MLECLFFPGGFCADCSSTSSFCLRWHPSFIPYVCACWGCASKHMAYGFGCCIIIFLPCKSRSLLATSVLLLVSDILPLIVSDILPCTWHCQFGCAWSAVLVAKKRLLLGIGHILNSGLSSAHLLTCSAQVAATRRWPTGQSGCCRRQRSWACTRACSAWSTSARSSGAPSRRPHTSPTCRCALHGLLRWNLTSEGGHEWPLVVCTFLGGWESLRRRIEHSSPAIKKIAGFRQRQLVTTSTCHSFSFVACSGGGDAAARVCDDPPAAASRQAAGTSVDDGKAVRVGGWAVCGGQRRCIEQPWSTAARLAAVKVHGRQACRVPGHLQTPGDARALLRWSFSCSYWRFPPKLWEGMSKVPDIPTQWMSSSAVPCSWWPSRKALEPSEATLPQEQSESLPRATIVSCQCCGTGRSY